MLSWDKTPAQEFAGSIFFQGGEMGERMRALDWSQTPLGPVEEWPQSLKTSVSTCLNSRFAILVWWGKQLVKIYNDAYAPLIGSKHPHALGAPGREVWPEIWHIIGPMLESVMEQGEATWSDNLLLELERNGYPEECYFTFSYSPIRDESGGVGGVFTPVQETTAQVIGERRLRTLHDLAEATRASHAQCAEDVGRIAGEVLAKNLYDIPFAALYLSKNGQQATLAGSAGITPAVAPETVRFDDAGWLFADPAQAKKPVVVSLPDGSPDIPCGRWPVPPKEVAVLPLAPSNQWAGFILLAVSPRRQLDEDYWSFFSLIARQVTTAIAETQALEAERQRAASLAELVRARKEAAEQAARILEGITDGFLAVNAEWCCTYVNAAAERLVNASREQLLGRIYWEMYPATLGTRMEEMCRLAMRDRVSGELEYYYEPWQRWFSIKIFPTQDGGISIYFQDTTQRIQAAGTLRRRTAELDSLLTHAPLGFAFFDREHRYLRINQELAHINGLPMEAHLGRTLAEVLPTNAPTVDPILEQVFTTGQAMQLEVTGETPKEPGVMRHWLAGFYPVVAEGEQVSAVGAFVLEITARKRMEEEARRGEATLNAVFDALPTSTVMAVPGGALVRMNRANERLWGGGPMSRNVEEYREWKGWWADGSARHGQPVQPEEWSLSRALAGESEPVQIVEIEPFDAPGRRLTVINQGAPIRDAEGRVIGAVVAQTDITERVRAERALVESEERFRTLADNISQFAWMTDETGWIFWYNQRWYDYTGTTLEEMQGWGWQKVHHPEHVERVTERFRSHITTGEAWEDTFPLRSKEGAWRWFLSRARPIRNADGKIVRWFGTNTDITEQLEIERDLRRANHDLEQFAFSASHDLQEPLRNVAIYSQLLQKRYGATLDEQAGQFLGFLVQGAQRMANLVADLLSYTQAAVLDDEPVSAVDAEEVFQEVLHSLRRAIQESGASVLHETLPSVAIKEAHLQQLLQNLISNAIKYRKDDEPPRVQVGTIRQAGFWCFSVRDNGIGIAPEYLNKVFGVFKRLHAQTSKYSGTGIGLAICQKIVERYDGRIWVESEPNVGSIFYFTVPAASDGK